jgi:hypothetical protein
MRSVDEQAEVFLVLEPVKGLNKERPRAGNAGPVFFHSKVVSTDQKGIAGCPPFVTRPCATQGFFA